MFNTALRIVGEQACAEDVLQEAFVSAFQNLSGYRSEAPFGTWLKRIVINKALKEVQKHNRDIMVIEKSGGEAEESRHWPEDPEPEYSVESVKRAMRALPSGFRTVLSLYLFEGYDHKEISEILNISESTSKTQYKRAKEKLKLILKQEVKYG